MPTSPTHAGGVVVRRIDDDVRYLLVTARRQDHLWVLPKGHIEIGETTEEAAAREVREEANVEAAVKSPLGMLAYRGFGGDVRALFFLMELISEGAGSTEGRRRAWMPLRDAQRSLGYEDAQRLLDLADEMLARER